MKKFMVYGLWFMAFLLSIIYYLPSAVYAAGASLSLSPASGTFNQGCSFSVDIILDTGGAQTDGTDAILFYDPTRFSANIRSGTIYSDYPGNNVDAQTGKITVSGLASVSSAFSGSGTLATIDFTVLGAAPIGATQVNFDFTPTDKAKTTDSNVVERGTVAEILDTVTNGSYTVGGGSCDSNAPAGGPGDATSSSSVILKPPPITQLPQGADFNTTFILTAVGGVLTVLGLLGLALL